jgi:hypothetical protein
VHTPSIHQKKKSPAHGFTRAVFRKLHISFLFMALSSQAYLLAVMRYQWLCHVSSHLSLLSCGSATAVSSWVLHGLLASSYLRLCFIGTLWALLTCSYSWQCQGSISRASHACHAHSIATLVIWPFMFCLWIHCIGSSYMQPLLLLDSASQHLFTMPRLLLQIYMFS